MMEESNEARGAQAWLRVASTATELCAALEVAGAPVELQVAAGQMADDALTAYRRIRDEWMLRLAPARSPR